MASAVTVARYILQCADEDKRSIIPLELIKLTYLAHGWSLAKRNKRLVDDYAEAWQYGPVYPDLYHILKKFRDNPVTRILDFTAEDRIALDEEEKALTKAVYDAYKKFTGRALSRLTHKDNSPWDITWRQRRGNSKIDDELIKDYYKKLDEE